MDRDERECWVSGYQDAIHGDHCRTLNDSRNNKAYLCGFIAGEKERLARIKRTTEYTK